MADSPHNVSDDSPDESNRFAERAPQTSADVLDCLAMETRRSAAVLGSMLLVSCNIGLDPREFERCEYGMPLAEVRTNLSEEAEPALRFFVRDPDGQTNDWMVEFHRTKHPHPNYYTAFRNGRLSSLVTTGTARPIASQWETDWDRNDLELIQRLLEMEALPLRWSDLEPHDIAEHSKDVHPTAYAIGLCIGFPFVIPLAPLVLISYPIVEAFIDEEPANERRALLVTTLSEAPAFADPAYITERIGDPFEREQVTETLEVWHYTGTVGKHYRHGLRIGIEDGRLHWVDFRSWRSKPNE